MKLRVQFVQAEPFIFAKGFVQQKCPLGLADADAEPRQHRDHPNPQKAWMEGEIRLQLIDSRLNLIKFSRRQVSERTAGGYEPAPAGKALRLRGRQTLRQRHFR